MANRIIFWTALNLALILSPSLAQSASPGSPPATGASHPSSIWEDNNLSPLLSRRYNRFEPGSLPERLVEQGQRYLKAPYRLGCSLKTGRSTDCSGFVQYLYGKANIHLPRASVEQARVGKVVAHSMDLSRLRAGDLLFFRDGGRHIGHVGIYLGEGKMIHAASHSHGVTVSDLHKPYYRSNFVVAKRLFAAPKSAQTPASKISTGSVIN